MTRSPAVHHVVLTEAASGAPPVVPGSFLLGSALDLRRDMLAAYERA